jgi:CubicO group peptidase (beta-lactamase class C family)
VTDRPPRVGPSLGGGSHLGNEPTATHAASGSACPVLAFSVTKGMTATALAVAHARRLLDYDAPVAAYWLEFAEAGKLASRNPGRRRARTESMRHRCRGSGWS